MDLGGLVNSLYQRAFQKGQEDGKKTGPAADELKKAVADARKAAQDELKAANPEMVVGTGTNGRANPAASMTLAQIDAEPYSQWVARPKEERERLLADAHRLASR